MSKNLVLMRDVICVHHPKFIKSEVLRNWGMEDPDIFNVERLVEQCLAAVGPYDLIDEAHADFSDGSDSKTASIRVSAAAPGSICYRGEISGVEAAGGGRKAGALRCTIYNPHKDELKFYFLPKSVWSQSITIHPTSLRGKIVYTYNKYHDYIPKFQGYECSSFTDLALAV